MSDPKDPTKRAIMIPVALSLAASLLVAGAGAWYFLQTRAPGLPALDPQKVALGQVVYEQSCTVCHGVNLEGQANWRDVNENGRLPAPPHDNSGHTWHHGDAVLQAIINDGTAAFIGGDYQSDMVGYRDILTVGEIEAVLEYIKSVWGPEERAFQEKLSQQERDVALSLAEQSADDGPVS